MNRSLYVVVIGMTAAGTACASGHASPETTPSVVPPPNAELRVVGTDSTWVVRGTGYELSASSGTDLARVQPALDRAAAMMSRVFPRDTLVSLMVRIRRAPAVPRERGAKGEGGVESLAAAPAEPSSDSGIVVDLVEPGSRVMKQRGKDRSGGSDAMREGVASARTIAPAIRAWLSAHANRVTGTTATPMVASGRAPDLRVPDWSVDMLAQLADSASAEAFTSALAAHQTSVIPLVEFLVMRSSSISELATADGGDYSGRREAGRGRGGAGSPPGGTPGMGGRRGGMGGMGGMRGGRRGPPGGARGGDGRIPLSGRLLYSAESAALGEFLARDGYGFIGELVDAQIAATPIDEVFARHGMQGLSEADESFRAWLSQRGTPAAPQGK